MITIFAGDDFPTLSLVLRDTDPHISPLLSALLFGDWHKDGRPLALCIQSSSEQGSGARKNHNGPVRGWSCSKAG
jgi:hypothetical protein